MWAGYAFAQDFRKKRGHAYMLEDQTFTERVQDFKQPGTCIHCHASVYVPYKKAGNGDLIKGFEHYNQMPYAEARKDFSHPISCIDCHAPDTMALRVTRPGFLEGIRAFKASQGVKDYDVNTMATRQEMRTFVCGQCHVEYYFKGAEKRLTYPWAKGLKVDQIYEYYREVGFTDWTHAETGAPALKAQHPEFEMWNQGIHARSGVACADCHMPYMREGALKISDHHVRSPLLNINRACQTCHKWSEDELKGRVETIAAAHGGSAEPGHGCVDGAHRRHQGGKGRRRGRPAGDRRAGVPAAGTVLRRLRRVGKLERLPRATGSGAHPGRGHRLPAAGAVGLAARARVPKGNPPAVTRQDSQSDPARSPPPLEPGRIALAQRGSDQAGWLRWLPGLQTLRGYQSAWLRHDIVAGLVLTTMLVPVGIAYAVASGVPGIHGLYATIVPLLAYALFGPSRILVLGPDSSLAAVILAVVLPLSGGDPTRAIALAAMMAIVSGTVCILAGVARLGFVTELLSKPIRYGYMNGIALTVLISQLPKIFGFSIESDGPVRNLLAIASAVLDDRANWTTFLVGAGTLAVILLLKGSKRVPGILIAVVGATIAVGALDLAARAGVWVSAPSRKACRRSPSRGSPPPISVRSSSAASPSPWCRSPTPACCRVPMRRGRRRMSIPTRRWSASARPTSPPDSFRAFPSAAVHPERPWLKPQVPEPS